MTQRLRCYVMQLVVFSSVAVLLSGIGWLTILVCNHPPYQLNLAIPPHVNAKSTSRSWGVNGHTALYPWSRSVSWCLAEG